MIVTRRDVLLGLGGGTTGLLLTPAPWKLLDDISIWTQHRRAVPIPPRGEISYRAAACTLCPGGCALRVRLVGGRPVSAVGQRGHPLGGGVCPLGLTIHHLAVHPLRLSSAARVAGDGRLQRITLATAVASAAAALRGGRPAEGVAILDQRPGRALSRLYREFLAGLPCGIYLAPPGEGATLTAMATMLDSPQPLGLDIESARTLLSFGAPVLDGWGRPGRVPAARRSLRVVQVDAWRSPTAALADEWLSIRPGGEGPLALGLAHVIVRDGLAAVAVEDCRPLLADSSPARIAGLVGVDAASIETLAHSLVAHGPALAVGGGDPGGGPLPAGAERAIAALNVLLGNVGRSGGVVPRAPVPEAESAAPAVDVTDLADVPERSIGLLILDAADSGYALPWQLLKPTLTPGALVVSLSPFRSGFACRAHVLVPAPAPLESYDEVLPAADASMASYGVTAPLLVPPGGTTEPAEFLRLLADKAGIPLPSAASLEDLLKQRATAIHAQGGGRFFACTNDGYSEAEARTPGEMWQRLIEGGCWIGARARGEGLRLSRRWHTALAHGSPPPADAGGDDLALVIFAARGTVGITPVSPVLSKLYQESNLRPSVGTAAIGSETARGLHLTDRARVVIESAAGSVEVELRVDPTLPPNRVALAAGPDLRPAPGASGSGAIALAVSGQGGTWRGTRVRVREARADGERHDERRLPLRNDRGPRPLQRLRRLHGGLRGGEQRAASGGLGDGPHRHHLDARASPRGRGPGPRGLPAPSLPAVWRADALRGGVPAERRGSGSPQRHRGPGPRALPGLPLLHGRLPVPRPLLQLVGPGLAWRAGADPQPGGIHAHARRGGEVHLLQPPVAGGAGQ